MLKLGRYGRVGVEEGRKNTDLEPLSQAERNILSIGYVVEQKNMC
jgi:hypothetical protein